ncbi:hypothetical protein [Mucilaginibacter sp.]|uniref:hypothetical protein n=1 Tax=Mucilaginibacter sp. TaxID=1882438 RepID=UPI003561DDAB
MHPSASSTFYNRYVDCLNSKRLENLDRFVNGNLAYDKKGMELKDYQQMLT